MGNPFSDGLGRVDIQLAKRFFEEKFAPARKKAQQDWTSCEHFGAAGGYFLPKTPPQG
ncbi:hypothetical protein ACG2K1_06045 [Neisseria sp. 23W00296]|uniref:hypothetical protein n=1 Tax=unclassified Neisseria TaxID=2623750 RepID=UPI003756885A